MDSGSAAPKDLLRKTIDDQPEDSSYEEIIRELAFAAMVERGLADSLAGRTVTHEEMRKRVVELFEARKPKHPAVISEIDGSVKYGGVVNHPAKAQPLLLDSLGPFSFPVGRNVLPCATWMPSESVNCVKTCRSTSTG